MAQALCRVRTFAAQTPRIPRPPTCRVPSYLGLVNKACVTMRAARMGSQGPRRDVHVCFAFVCGLPITRNANARYAALLCLGFGFLRRGVLSVAVYIVVFGGGFLLRASAAQRGSVYFT